MDQDPKDFTCPRCLHEAIGVDETFKVKRSYTIIGGDVKQLSKPKYVLVRRIFQCASCGHTWTESGAKA